jgi:drug/metabolite transporter (DMT)-like permease
MSWKSSIWVSRLAINVIGLVVLEAGAAWLFVEFTIDPYTRLRPFETLSFYLILSGWIVVLSLYLAMAYYTWDTSPPRIPPRGIRMFEWVVSLSALMLAMVGFAFDYGSPKAESIFAMPLLFLAVVVMIPITVYREELEPLLRAGPGGK